MGWRNVRVGGGGCLYYVTRVRGRNVCRETVCEEGLVRRRFQRPVDRARRHDTCAHKTDACMRITGTRKRSTYTPLCWRQYNIIHNAHLHIHAHKPAVCILQAMRPSQSTERRAESPQRISTAAAVPCWRRGSRGHSVGITRARHAFIPARHLCLHPEPRGVVRAL